MLWVLQTNLYNEKAYGELVSILDRMDIPKLFVKPVPFSDRLVSADADTSKALDVDSTPDIPDPDGPAIAMGSYTLAKLAHKRGWKPGAFLDGLSYDVWSQHWGDRILNPNAEITKFGAASISVPKFIRPVEDSKSFSGKVFTPEEWSAWQNSVVKSCGGEDPLNSDTEIIISEPVKIWTENRIWVIDGKLATHSQYKRGNTVHYSSDVDAEVLLFAKSVVAEWRPNDAFVLDIAQTPDGCKVVEANCLNAAGFYAGDMSKLVMALEERFG